MEDQLAYLIASVNRQLEDELAETLKPEGIPIEQFRILSALASVDGRAMRDLAGAVLIDPASLTKIIDRMVSDALVYRTLDPGDRRKVLICLAARARRSTTACRFCMKISKDGSSASSAHRRSANWR